ncbi:MAG: PRC-barrel domain-containing protein, partial [Nitrosospira sp.]
MLRSIKDLEGFAAEATDGLIGHVKDFYFDDEAWTIRFLVVETGAWLEGRKVLISPVAIGVPDWVRRLLPVSVTREQVRKSPDVDSQKPISRQHEVENYAYYGFPYYWGGLGIWGDSMRPEMMLAD